MFFHKYNASSSRIVSFSLFLELGSSATIFPFAARFQLLDYSNDQSPAQFGVTTVKDPSYFFYPHLKKICLYFVFVKGRVVFIYLFIYLLKPSYSKHILCSKLLMNNNE